MATSVDIAPVIVVRELESGWAYAFPVGDPSLVCRAPSVSAALLAQERFLTAYLANLPASRLSDFTRPADLTLLELPVVVPRADLEKRLRVTSSITVPCLRTDGMNGAWVHILPFRSAVFIEAHEDLTRRAIAEVEKAARVRALESVEYRALLPAASVRLERVEIEVGRKTIDDLSARAAARRKQASAHTKEVARKLLASIGVDLVRGPSRPPVVGREREQASLAALLGGKERLSVVLVGPESAGKSSIVEGLVQAAKRDAAAGNPFAVRPIFATSGAQLVAGQSGFGQLEERIGDVMRAAEELDAILYFDNFGDLLAGRSGSIEDMVGAIRPYVADDRVRLAGELTPEQVEHYEKLHVGFFSSLSRVSVEPLTKQQTLEVVDSRRRYFSKREPDRPNLEASAVEPLVELSDRYLSYRAFPGKSVRLFEELRAMHEAEVTDAGTARPIVAYDVYRSFSVRSGIPLFLLRDDQSVKFDAIVSHFSSAVVGQVDAVKRVAQTLCMIKAELAPPAKPLANFLFVGPTGVGKTEVAKTLARFLFGSADRMLRFDMSEYMDPLAADRLIRGSERDEGELTRRVRQQPFCVILLDEIEKAHAAVFDLLLQVCGEGRLSDARGQTTYFHNAIIIMTSNLGAAHRRPSTGFSEPTRSDAARAAQEDRYYLDQVDKHFRPEFVNRIDRVIPFRQLSRSEIRDVARVALRRVREREGILAKNVDLEVSDAALDAIAQAGYSELYGARAFRRHLEDVLVAPLSSLLAEFADEVAGGGVSVCLPEEPEPARIPQDGRLLTERTVADLVFRAISAPSKRTRETLGDLQFVSALRRQSDRCLNSEPILELRERVQYLIADLATGSRAPTTERAPDLSALGAEFGRLRDLLADVDDAALAVAAAEELAMAAQLEGEPAQMFREDAEDAFARFESAFVRAVLGHGAGDGISLVVRTSGHAEAARRWITTFLHGCAGRNWDVVLHRHGDAASENWPPALQWGPPRSASWCLERLRDAKTVDISREWRDVLLCVSGPIAAGLMRMELGITAYAPTETDKIGGRVWLYRMEDRAGLSSTDLGGKAFALPEQPKPDVVSKMTPARLWVDPYQLEVPASGIQMRFDGAGDYWAQLERVQFSILAPEAIAGREILAD